LNWRWTARRLGISAFLALHLSAVLIINMPPSPLRAFVWWPVAYYLIPVGLDQSWGMFAPNPVQHPATIDVRTVDKDGIERTYAFPKMADLSRWKAIPRVRHSKFTSVLGQPTSTAHREFATRYAIRQLKIPPSSFPVEAEFVYQIRETPPLGEPPRDPLKPPVTQVLATYRFPSMAEVMP
jgi:hypothetical protein